MSNEVFLLNKSLSDFQRENEYSNEDLAFQYFSTIEIFKDKDLSIDEISSGIINHSNDAGIDGFYLFINNEAIFTLDEFKHLLDQRKDEKREKQSVNIDLYLFQYKNSKKIQDIVVDRFLGTVDYLFNLECLNDPDILESNDKLLKYKNILCDDLIEKIILFKKAWTDFSSLHPDINIYYNHVCKGILKDELDSRTPSKYSCKVDVLRNTIKTYGLDNINYKVYDAKILLDLYRKKQEYTLDIDLNENPIAIDYIFNEKDGKVGNGYIASVNIFDYKKLLTDEDGNLRKYLFESNVRDYQNNTEVNKAIRDSIANNHSYDFWWLNNGVTIIANKGSLTGKKIHLDNLQIVNGLQTSYSIFKSDIKETDNRSLLLKIIITNDKEVDDLIIKSTNSQNYIHPSLFRSTEAIQRNIEEFLYKHNYYYDRRKNFYKNEGKPIKSIVSINHLAQSIYSIIFKHPCKARQSPSALTKSDKTYDQIFHSTRKLQVYLNCLLIVDKVNDYLKTLEIEDNKIKENIQANYMFHVARIVPSILFNTANVDERDIETFDISQVDEDVLKKAVNILEDIIKEYSSIKENNNLTLTNMAKRLNFSKYITDSLKNKLK